MRAVRRARYRSEREPDHSEREMSVWNARYQCACYCLLFGFNPFGDLERFSLRPVNVRSAGGMCSSLLLRLALTARMGQTFSSGGYLGNVG